MTRRDYIKLAEAMKDSRPATETGLAAQQWRLTITKLADKLHYDNPRFDYKRFVEACGGGE